MTQNLREPVAVAVEVRVQALVGSTGEEDGLPKYHHPLLDNSMGAELMILTTPTPINSRVARANSLHVPGRETKGQMTVLVGVCLPVLPTREVRDHQGTVMRQ